MKKALLFVALAMALALAVEANAGEDNRDPALKAGWLAKDAIKSKLYGLGYSVRKIEPETAAMRSWRSTRTAERSNSRSIL